MAGCTGSCRGPALRRPTRPTARSRRSASRRCTELLLGIDRWLGIVGGCVLLVLAARPCATPADRTPRWRARLDSTRPGDPIAGWASMVALTLTNPATILSFAALFASIGAGTGGTSGAAAVVAGVFLGSVAWWAILTGDRRGPERPPDAARHPLAQHRVGGDHRRVRGRGDRLADRGRWPMTPAPPAAPVSPPLFDWDGTIVDTLPLIYRANVVVLGELGITLSRDVVPRALHARLARLVPRARGPRGSLGRRRGALVRGDAGGTAAGAAVGPRRRCGGWPGTAWRSAS